MKAVPLNTNALLLTHIIIIQRTSVSFPSSLNHCSDILGLTSRTTSPRFHVGMCFSIFNCTNRDHDTCSVHYQHVGATKTWYCVPPKDATRFNQAVLTSVPESSRQPDSLFRLVAKLSPDELEKAGVRVYILEQQAGQVVITFPQRCYAGFNHNFSFNEAVDFVLPDPEPLGQAGVERLHDTSASYVSHHSNSNEKLFSPISTAAGPAKAPDARRDKVKDNESKPALKKLAFRCKNCPTTFQNEVERDSHFKSTHIMANTIDVDLPGHYWALKWGNVSILLNLSTRNVQLKQHFDKT